MKVYQVPYEQLKINIEDFTDIFGGDGETLNHELQEVLSIGEEIIDAQGIIRIFDDIQIEKSHIVVSDILFECGRKIALQLKSAEKGALFVCTVGEGVSLKYKEYMQQNEYLKAYFADTLGSIAVEKAMDIIQRQLSESMESENMKITNRYSPGYCGWLVKEQSKLFSLLPKNPCGIRLSESSLMIPSKSISGIIGIGKNVRFSQYECQLCELEQCIYRKSRKSHVATVHI